MKRCFVLFAILCVLCTAVSFPVYAAQPTAIASTTMLTDLTKVIAGDTLEVIGLMGPGLDPHVYEASAGDVHKLQKADLVLVHGLHLEGRLGNILANLEKMNKKIIVLEDALDPARLLTDEENPSIYDPHVWFDVNLWADCAKYVAEQLGRFYPEHQALYSANLDAYLAELAALDVYIKEAVEKIPEQSRVLVTAHDAFRYFGRAYGIEVKGLQGISTEAEAGTAGISDMAKLIAERQIKAIFVETSVSDKSIKALQEAVHSLGFETNIGGGLFSDSTGDAAHGQDTYLAMLRHNIDTIVSALQ